MPTKLLLIISYKYMNLGKISFGGFLTDTAVNPTLGAGTIISHNIGPVEI